jgi:two-component system response regulator (stage 0 sporulation protein A)
MMKQVNVLIADNCCEFTKLFSEYLSLNPDINIVGIAEDGAETVDLLQQTRPDVLLLDLVMPRIDGLEVLRRISANSRKPKVLVVSAIGSEEVAKRALELGADFYFIKPLNLKAVVAKILETRTFKIRRKA